MKNKIFVTVSDHFDIMWRRPFLKRFENENRLFVSYADIERMYILENMKLAEKYPDYVFEIESPMVADTFLHENPEQRDRMEKLMQNHQVQVEGAGYVIIDANMASGESIVRNYLLEQNWRREERMEPLPLAIRSDAFGNPAQLPQILRGFGYRWVNGLSYVPCPELYWKGLDGSVVCTASLPVVGGKGNSAKNEPCPHCRGYGKVFGEVCPVCRGTGLDLAKTGRMTSHLHMKENIPGDSMVSIGGEEFLPSEEIITELEAWKDRYDIVFAGREEVYPLLEEKINAVDADQLDPAAVHPSSDLNPVCTGCYVSRIRTKQMARRLEHQLMANDTLAAILYMSGKKLVVPDENLWKNMMYLFFHDSVTGTHVDAAYEEVQEYWKKTERGMTEQRHRMLLPLRQMNGEQSFFNPAGTAYSGVLEVPYLNPDRPLTRISDNPYVVFLENFTDRAGCRKGRFLVRRLPPYTAVSFRGLYGDDVPEQPEEPEKKEEQFHGVIVTTDWESRGDDVSQLQNPQEIRNEFFDILADQHGLVEIYDRTLEKKISAAGAYRPLEWILTHDDGSPWATLADTQSENRLSPFTSLQSCEKTEAYERLTYTLSVPSYICGASHNTEMTYTITLYAGVARVDCSADVLWNNYSKRLRIVLPLTETGRHLYEVPFGMVERQPYTPVYGWTGSNGDYPASNWVGVETGAYSAALFNRGTPSCRILDREEGSVVYMSVLRSPHTPTYLHEEQFYTMTAWEGMRDAGAHHFDCAVQVYGTPFADSAVVADADMYNTPLVVTEGTLTLPEMPAVVQGQAYISCVKLAEDQQAVMVRLTETAGRTQTVTVHLPAAVTHLSKAALNEEFLADIDIRDGNAVILMKPYEIVTLRIENT